MITYEIDDDIAILTIDDPHRDVNTMHAGFGPAITAAVDWLVANRDNIAGAVITSGKSTFFAGGDLEMLMNATPADAEQIAGMLDALKVQFRRIEKFGKPVVAAINGAALGGGFEIALACHYRVVVDNPRAVVGLPEVTLGLLPGAGGVTRTVRMLGLGTALQKVLLTGAKFRPAQALELGLVDQIAPDLTSLLTQAKELIASNPTAQAPWDTKGYKLPGGSPSSPTLAAMLPVFTSSLRKQTRGQLFPAPHHVLAAAVEGAQVDFDSATVIETRYCTDLICGQISHNVIKTMFFELQKVSKGSGRATERKRYTKAAVIGAGMMGAGIAYSCARSGIDVVLKDVSVEAAQRGKAYSEGLVEKAVSRGRLTPEAAEKLLARITATADTADLAGCDIVIEAVFESPQLKQEILAQAQSQVNPDALLSSNTSTLPITLLAGALTRPEDFIGLHFFSPVDKMQLLEIVVGEKTSAETVAHAVDLALQIGKVPIVVNDSRGFFTSRVIGKFLDEAVAMVGEGIPPASIEQAAVQAGYPVGPLALMDELTLTLPRKIRQETQRGVEESGGSWDAHPAEQVIDTMIDQCGRTGRSTGAGFYDYDNGTRGLLWSGLSEVFGRATTVPPLRELSERMLFAEAIDAVRCLDEGVLRSVGEANVGSILGIGFPVWTGGVLQYVNQYEGGVAGFVARANELADIYGTRLQPPASLVELAANGGVLS